LARITEKVRNGGSAKINGQPITGVAKGWGRGSPHRTELAHKGRLGDHLSRGKAGKGYVNGKVALDLPLACLALHQAWEPAAHVYADLAMALCPRLFRLFLDVDQALGADPLATALGAELNTGASQGLEKGLPLGGFDAPARGEQSNFMTVRAHKWLCLF